MILLLVNWDIMLVTVFPSEAFIYLLVIEIAPIIAAVPSEIL